jgi:hypothetical protein
MATLRFAAFGQDDAPLGGPEIGPVYLTTRDATLVAPPATGDAQGLAIDGSRLALALGDGFIINVRWAMPGFGYLWLQADNGGQCYAIPRVGNAQVWNLNYELARTRVLWNSQIDSVSMSHLPLVPKPVRKAVDEAGTLLHDAMFANHDRRSRLADDALARALDGGERLAVCAARLAAQQQARLPVPHGTSLRLAGPVGADVLGSETSRTQWQAVFDEATVTITPDDLAAGGGSELDARVAAALDVARSVRARGLLPYLDADGQPAVARDESEATRWCDAAVALVRRYSDRIATWELVPPVLGGMLTERHVMPIVATAQAVKEARADVTLVLWPGDFFAPRIAPPKESSGPGFVRGAVPVYLRCRALTQAIDALAVALYWPNGDLLQLARTVDMVARLGRPVHLVCAAVPSRWQIDPRSRLGRSTEFVSGLGFWRHPWTPDVQAAYATGLAQLARAHPAVNILEWLDFSDAAPHEFPHAGLLDAAGQPKPLHEQLIAARANDFAVRSDWCEGL